ncbi:MAG: aminopeptidase P family protein [Chloroflexi bacterium]|nr:aminopeptidase P family protein [Chloroflexota bacterium]
MDRNTGAIIDTERVERLRRQMVADGLDALFLRLPENILYASGFWPVTGFCAALVPVAGDGALFIPNGEDEYAGRSWIREIYPVAAGALDRLASPSELMAPALREACIQRGLSGAAIGYEAGFDLVATAHWQGEVRVPAASTVDLLRSALPGATLRDAAPTLRRSRAIKSRREIAAIRRACEVAGLGIGAAREVIRPGATELEVALAVQSRIAAAAGDDAPDVERSGGFATVMSGPLSANARLHFNISSRRHLEPGDHLTIELGAYADGYWTDLTRVYAVSLSGEQQRTIYALVRRAQEAAIAALRPGVLAREVDDVARRLIVEAGYGPHFPHGLGHSVGLQWHEPPMLHPASDHALSVGEVYTIEPGIYLDGWGGIRLEDVVAVTEAGGEVLSRSEPELLSV